MPHAGNIYESFEIAQWADGHSKRPEAANLFPSGKLGDIKRCTHFLSSITNVLYITKAGLYVPLKKWGQVKSSKQHGF